ncbi:MAG: PIN domain-containing protein [Parasporobacterium sp.]|nr:PIN domain-containing protein [Parasporobacterium sp.]
MKVLIDTCVIVDFLQDRKPFSDKAREILLFAAADAFSGFITAKSATDIYYLTRRCTHSDKESRSKLNRLLTVIGMLDSTADDVFRALSSDISDFEDAVMIESATRSGVDCIVTRNIKDYGKSAVPVYTPEQFSDMLKKQMQ